MLCLASCSAAENGTEEKSEAASSTTNALQTENETKASAELQTEAGEEVTLGYAAMAEKLSLGNITKEGYENESAGFKIENLGDSWKETGVNQIANAFDCGIDPDTNKAIYSISEDASLYYLCDVMYTNKDDDSVISVSLLENENGVDLSGVVLEDEGSNLVKGFENSEELYTGAGCR